MTSTISRRTLLTHGAAGVTGATAVAGVPTQPADASAAALDAQYVSPFAPHPTIAYPSSWYAFTGLTEVSIPSGVYISDQHLAPINAVSGLPDVRALPSSVTLLGVFHQWFPSAAAASGQELLGLHAGGMRFSDLVGGNPVEGQAGFRNFSNAYLVTWQGGVYGLQVDLWVGPDAGSEWQLGQQVVDSITVSGAS